MKGNVKLISLLVVIMLLAFGAIVLADSTTVEQQVAIALPAVDFNCDTEITVVDALMVIPQIGEFDAPTLWAYDLDKDGEITTRDAHIVVAENGNPNLPVPAWCANAIDSVQ